MNITIISVGKIKEKYIKLGIEEFSKRLSRYCKLTMIEVPDEKTPDNASDREMELIKDKEGKQILSKIKENMYVIAMDLQGEMKTSEQFAKQLSQLALSGDSNVAFIIGGSLGLSDEVKKRANYKLCFSKMTFPHQLFKLILLEQVYRAYRINNNEPYHK
ncbi:MAG: 23S rRNA (pseudouridine(1915)-N(3))-methyltransferase RlmH [Turicibacter sp.]|nr:23S rRNA (pseudouridine(1915)-N(3))-methyltransferase RlmH [Turicibacter sp.]